MEIYTKTPNFCLQHVFPNLAIVEWWPFPTYDVEEERTIREIMEHLVG